jgi:hypothetical protein
MPSAVTPQRAIINIRRQCVPQNELAAGVQNSWYTPLMMLLLKR